jgi:tripartite-type tricarboxylate transporter receptor subunit TctC
MKSNCFKTRMLLGFLFPLFFIFITTPGFTAGYPDRPITYLIAFSPGGESDITARMQQKYLEEDLKTKILITYKTGGGGSVCWSELVRTKPDGYTIAGVNEPHTILQPLQRADTGYKTEDLTRIACFQYTPSCLVVRKDSPFKTLSDLVDFAKKNPGVVTIGGTGTWASTHFAYLLFEKAAGIKLTYIPYSGSGATKPAVLGGHVSSIVGHPTQAVELGDQVRVLAVCSEERSKVLPNVPTFKELGYQGVVEGSYRGVAAPPGTPKEAVEILANVFKKINFNPEFQRKMTEMGFDLLWWGPDEYNAQINKRREYYKKLLAEFGFKK